MCGMAAWMGPQMGDPGAWMGGLGALGAGIDAWMFDLHTMRDFPLACSDAWKCDLEHSMLDPAV